MQIFSPLSVAFTPAIASAVQPNRDRRRERQSGRRTPCPGRVLPEQRPRYRCRCITRQRVPLYDSHDLLTFAQGGIRRAEDRTQSSLGLGVHSFGHDSMLGASAFIDHDLSRSHTRAGLGIEYWRDNLRLGANSYMHLSGWKDTPDVTDHLERPANGWDITKRGWLPSAPQVGASLGFDVTNGAITARKTLIVQRQVWTGHHSHSSHSVSGSVCDSRVRYIPGASWAHQTSPDSVAALRSLSGGRHDLVYRNSNIVLENKKRSYS